MSGSDNDAILTPVNDAILTPVNDAVPKPTDVKALLRRTAAKPCECPICVTSRSLGTLREATRALDDASNAWLEREADLEGSYYYLMDEVRDALKLRNMVTSRRRLRRALKFCLEQIHG